MFCFLTATGAMTFLALICVKRSFYFKGGQKRANENYAYSTDFFLMSLVHRIMVNMKGSGLIGNDYSTEVIHMSQKAEEIIMKKSNVRGLLILCALCVSYINYHLQLFPSCA